MLILPAITVIFLSDGRAVQTAGLDTPVEQQIETLSEAGRLNQSPVPGAIRGEVWTSGQVRARTFFEPTAAPDPIPVPGMDLTPDEIRDIKEMELQLEAAAARAAAIAAQTNSTPPKPTEAEEPMPEVSGLADESGSSASPPSSPPPISGKRKPS